MFNLANAVILSTYSKTKIDFMCNFYWISKALFRVGVTIISYKIFRWYKIITVKKIYALSLVNTFVFVLPCIFTRKLFFTLPNVTLILYWAQYFCSWLVGFIEFFIFIHTHSNDCMHMIHFIDLIDLIWNTIPLVNPDYVKYS